LQSVVQQCCRQKTPALSTQTTVFDMAPGHTVKKKIWKLERIGYELLNQIFAHFVSTFWNTSLIYYLHPMPLKFLKNETKVPQILNSVQKTLQLFLPMGVGLAVFISSKIITCTHIMFTLMNSFIPLMMMIMASSCYSCFFIFTILLPSCRHFRGFFDVRTIYFHCSQQCLTNKSVKVESLNYIFS
jgi:hypothetical protein